MTVGRIFILMIISACFWLMILVSCESHQEKSDDAFERVKEDKVKPIGDNKGEQMIREWKNAKSLVKKPIKPNKIIVRTKVRFLEGTISVKHDSIVLENKTDQNQLNLKEKWERLERK